MSLFSFLIGKDILPSVAPLRIPVLLLVSVIGSFSSLNKQIHQSHGWTELLQALSDLLCSIP